MAVSSPSILAPVAEPAHSPIRTPAPSPTGPRRPARRPWVHVPVVLAFALLAFVLACALVPQWIAPYSPSDMLADAILQPPGAAHWFGTDQFGRDVFSLVVHAARPSVAIGFAAVLIGGGLGVVLGLVAGYAGGWVDTLLMRLVEVWMAVPYLLLAMALATALGPSLRNTILAISLAMVPRFARVLRGQALAVRGRAFVEAARMAGASHLAVLRGHILPHCVATVLVMATLGIGTAILTGSALSFLGIGVSDERPDWGYLLTQGRAYLTVAWWTVTFPGFAITALVIAVNVLGDALRRRLDPRSGPR